MKTHNYIFLLLLALYITNIQSMEEPSHSHDDYIYFMQLQTIAEHIVSTANEIKISGKTFLHSDVRKSHEADPRYKTKQGFLVRLSKTSLALLSSFGSWQILTYAQDETFKAKLIKTLCEKLEVELHAKNSTLYAITKIKHIQLPHPHLDKDIWESENSEILKKKWEAMKEKYNQEWRIL